MQGYKHDGTTRTPNTTWITSINETSDWLAANDPCALELGSGWRIPTYTEWNNVDASGGWSNWNGPWNSALKIHAAGNLSSGSGLLVNRGSVGNYWSRSALEMSKGQYLQFLGGVCNMSFANKSSGFSVRCIK